MRTLCMYFVCLFVLTLEGGKCALNMNAIPLLGEESQMSTVAVFSMFSFHFCKKVQNAEAFPALTVTAGIDG